MTLFEITLSVRFWFILRYITKKSFVSPQQANFSQYHNLSCFCVLFFFVVSRLPHCMRVNVKVSQEVRERNIPLLKKGEQMTYSISFSFHFSRPNGGMAANNLQMHLQNGSHQKRKYCSALKEKHS